MEVKEVQERINVLNKAISELLLQFENETNLPITCLTFVRRHNESFVVGEGWKRKLEYAVDSKSEIKC